MSDNYVGLMAKYPESGNVKTRLAQSLGDKKALLIYKKLLDNCVLQCTDKTGRFTIIPFITPVEKILQFKFAYPLLDEVFPQTGHSLGERMFHALSTLKDVKHAGNVLLIGADIPELNSAIITQAFSHLESSDIVIGPTTDGGYYLIGMKNVHLEIFQDINYGTKEVLKQTIAKATKAKLTFKLLSELSDIDRIEDLKLFDEYRYFLQ